MTDLRTPPQPQPRNPAPSDVPVSLAGRQPLPIDLVRPALRAALTRSPRVILQSPTGSGKSTRVPAFLLEDGLAGDGQILVLQPRRIAARMLARRVAEEAGEPLGQTIGYRTRFEGASGPKTRILFITEGILLRRVLDDPTLRGVGAVVFDEFHERHLQGDIGLAICREIQRQHRPDLRLVVMSATLETGQLSTYLAPAEVLRSEGRTFAIEITYQPPGVSDGPVWERAAAAFRQLARRAEGDFLVFMPGAYEITKTIEAIAGTPEGRGCRVIPLHGELPPEAQDAAVGPCDRRKVVVATNVAETSLTVPGVRLVIDSGLARQANYDPQRGLNTLLIEPISQASADQRAGRAGRTAPGHCCRLWPEKEHPFRPVQTTPELLRIDLSETLLSLVAAGFNPATFPWLDAPTPHSLQRGLTLLADLGALDREGRLTLVGRKMAAFPLHPRHSRLLLAADAVGGVPTACRLAAITQQRDLMLPLNDRRDREERDELLGETTSDLFHRLTLYGMARKQDFSLKICQRWGIHAQSARMADRTAQQLLQLAQRQGLDTARDDASEDDLRRCVLVAFADHLALRENAATLRCRLLRGRRGELRRTSAVREAGLIVATEIDEIETRGEATVFLNLATAVEEFWLQELFPGEVIERNEAVYDVGQKRVINRRQTEFRGLILASGERGQPSEDAAAALLAAEVRRGHLELAQWDEKIDRWIARMNFAAQHCPELEIPPLDDDGRHLIIEQACVGCISAKDVRQADVWPHVKSWLSREQRAALDQLVPESFTLPRRGRPTPLRYEGDRVVLSSRLQDFYDADPSKLNIAGGRVPLTLELLAPNGRPAQTTTNLAAFWNTSYPEIRKQLKGRYPKHEWR